MCISNLIYKKWMKRQATKREWLCVCALRTNEIIIFRTSRNLRCTSAMMRCAKLHWCIIVYLTILCANTQNISAEHGRKRSSGGWMRVTNITIYSMCGCLPLVSLTSAEHESENKNSNPRNVCWTFLFSNYRQDYVADTLQYHFSRVWTKNTGSHSYISVGIWKCSQIKMAFKSLNQNPFER